jgi:hypothetical protein
MHHFCSPYICQYKMKKHANMGRIMAISFMKQSSSVKPLSTHDDTKMKFSEDFSDIYFFRSPGVYFSTVEVCIVLNSLYLSLWLINFVSVTHFATKKGDHYPEYMWQLCM